MSEYIDYLRGYATPRDDSAYAGLNADFGRRLMTMLQAAPEHVRRPDLIESLARDDAAQRRAINSVAQRLYGRPASIMEYTRGIPGYAAPVGGSQHQSGHAADLNWGRLSPEGRDWMRSNAGAYGLRFPLPDTDAGHLEYDANWQGTLPNTQPASVSRLPVEPPPIMNSALMGLSASRSKPETSMPPIFSGAMRGFRDGGAVEAALRIASKQTDKNPTDAQKESGRYAKGTFSWNGLKVAIENPKGSKRSGVDKTGKRWECTLPATYGFVRGTEAVDGDAVDCYVGPDHDSGKVFIIDQVDAQTKKYDEPKCMLSYPDKAAAVADYRKAFSDGKADDRIGAVSEMSVDAFKDWVKSPASRKPVGKFANGGTVMPSTTRNPAVSLALDVARRQKRADGGSVASEPLANPRDLLKYPRAFGAGLVDPMGVTGYAARGVAHVAPDVLSPETARSFADRMAGYRDESPMAAGIGTMMIPGFGAGRALGLTAREVLSPGWLGNMGALGGIGGNVYEAVRDQVREDARGIRPLPGAPYAGGGRVGYADGGEPLVPGGLPPLPEEMFIRTPVNTLTGNEQDLEARQPIPEMNRNPADYTRALALALADPMQLPSAVTGAFSPETRDAWRAGYEGREEAIDAASALTPWGTLTKGATAAATALPRAFAALPRPAQAVAAGAGALTALPPDASPAGQAARDPRLSRIEKLETDIVRNQRALEKLGTTNLQSRTAREAASKPYNDAITIAQEEIKRLTTAMEGETADVRRREQEATRAQDWANTPWSKAYPWLPYATTGAGIGLGLYGANRIASRGVNNYNAAIDSLGNDWRAALARTENARAPAARQQALSEANAIQSRIGEVATPGMGMPIMAGIAGTELGMAAPTVLDYLGSRQLPPDAPLRRSVSESMDPTNLDVLGRYLLGAGIGVASGKYVTSLANSRLRPPPELGPRTSSLNERYPAIESELASPPALPPARPSLPEALPVETPPSRPALPAPEARAPTSREAAPSTASERPPHHSHLQPRVSGQFAGPPKKPRKPRRDPEAEAADHHTRDDRLTRGQKNGGFVSSALEIARRYMGGSVNRAPYADGGSVAGPIIGDDGGRDDMKPVSVKSGSFVIPSDVVSGLPGAGGNTLAGMRILEEQFGKPDPRAMAAGGPATDVPIRISSGEFVVSPDQVAKVGGGDMQKGHMVLDKMVVALRKQHAAALTKLPPPARD